MFTLTATGPAERAGSCGCRTDLLVLAVLAGLCWVPIGVVAFLAAAGLVLWLPGRSIVRMLAPVAAMPARLVSTLGASILFVPLYLNVVWMWTHRRWPVFLAAVFLNAALILLSRSHETVESRHMTDSRAVRVGLLVLTGYVCTFVFLFYWLPSGSRRLAASPSGDYIKHHAVLSSLARHPLPLHNPFFAAQADAPYYYYHYHYLLPTAARRLAGDSVSIAAAFGFTSALVAGLFIMLVFLIARGLLASGSGAFLSAVCATVVGGWDIIPVTLRALRGHTLVVVLDSWSPFQWRIHNVLDNFIWCPQHVSAVVCLLLCAYWLTAALDRRTWLVIAPLAAASLFGTSLYQAATMFAAAGLWLVFASRDRRSIEPNARWRPMGPFAMLFATFMMGLQAWQYQVMSRRYPGGLTIHWERFTYAFVGNLAPPGVIANLLDAPWLVLLEFGLPGLACLLVTRAVWRDAWRHPGVRLLILAGGIGLVTMFLVRSSTTPIDYAFRAAVMPANVVAAMMVGAMLRPERVRRWVRWWRVPLIVLGCALGLPVGAYELPVMATRTIFQDKFQPGTPGVLRFLRDRLPPDAVVQGDPRNVNLPQVIERPLGVLDPDNPHVLVLRPPEPSQMYDAFGEVDAALASEDAAQAYEILSKWGITHVMFDSPERRRYGSTPRFADPALFEPVYTEAGSAVYRLRPRQSRGASTRDPD